MTKTEILQEFVEFSPTKFLDQSKKWQGDLEKKQRELVDLPELPAIESDGVMTSGISDMTYRLSLERMELENEINALKSKIEIKEWALSHIPSFDRELIEGFFFPKVKIYFFVDDFGRENGLCRSDVYAARREALENFAELIVTRYGL